MEFRYTAGEGLLVLEDILPSSSAWEDTLFSLQGESLAREVLRSYFSEHGILLLWDDQTNAHVWHSGWEIIPAEQSPLEVASYGFRWSPSFNLLQANDTLAEAFALARVIRRHQIDTTGSVQQIRILSRYDFKEQKDCFDVEAPPNQSEWWGERHNRRYGDVGVEAILPLP